MSSTRDIITNFGEFTRGTSGLLTGAALLSVSATHTMNPSTLADLHVPIISDFYPVLGSIPLIGMVVGGFKLLNASRSLYMGFTEQPSISEQTNCLGERSAKTESYINAGLECVSGSVLLGFCYQVFSSSATLTFAYLSFMISSSIDLIRALDRLFHTYLTKECSILNNSIYKTAMVDCLVSLLKCIGWSLLAFSASPLAIHIGWLFIGAATTRQIKVSLMTGSTYILGLFSSKTSSGQLFEKPSINEDEYLLTANAPHNKFMQEAASRPFI